MKLQTMRERIEARRARTRLDYARKKLEGKPSPLRPGAPESAQSLTGGPDELRFVA